MSLNERKKKILEAIVLDYTSTAELVGSRTLSKKYNLGISPATIRNEMSDLEELGYIEQPHTSAGRMPSDLGYRYYVDYIMEKNRVDEEVERIVRDSFKKKVDKFDDVIKLSMDMIAKITNYPSMVLASGSENLTLSFIKLLKVKDRQALLIIISESQSVENIFVDLPIGTTEEDLNIVSHIINEKLKGFSASEWGKTMITEIYNELIQQKNVLNSVLEAIEDTLKERKRKRVYLTGVLQMLNEPEFKDLSKIKALFSLLDDKQMVKEILETTQERDGVVIKIGNENEINEIKECSLVKANYRNKDNIQGTLGIIGPRRMKYSTVTSILELISEIISKNF